MIKLFKDCMTRCSFWDDDSQVCSEVTQKFYGCTSGIYVEIEEITE
jgi:Holliday junction resolvase RusA-like endonuclease